jgi:transposase InsO family protein
MSKINDAVNSGVPKAAAAQASGLCAKTLERWQALPDGGDDRRQGPKTTPSNALSKAERNRIIELANSPEFRALAPSQIVPRLADAGIYAGSESTFYRTLKAEGLLAHRASSKPRVSRAPERHQVTERHRLFSWDITYLKSPVRGQFFYLYLVEDVWSRKIVGFDVHKEECADHSARLIERICSQNAIDSPG